MLKPVESLNTNTTFLDQSGDVFDLVDSVITMDELWELLSQFVLRYDLTALTYYHMPPAGSRDYDSHHFITRGKNRDAVAAYKSALFDPNKTFIHTAKRCDNVTLFSPSSQFDYLSKEQCDLFKKIHAEDCAQGLVIPVHSAKGRSGCFVFETNQVDKAFSKSDVRQLKWICQSAHNSFCRIRKRLSKSIKKLTAREKQILTWVARGKSNSVIADIIGISQHTVNGYLRSIYLKTGTSDRTTAALRGVGESLIDL